MTIKQCSLSSAVKQDNGTNKLEPTSTKAEDLKESIGLVNRVTAHVALFEIPLATEAALGEFVSRLTAKTYYSKQRKLSLLRKPKSGKKIYRSTCCINRLQPSLRCQTNFFSCNVALGEPNLSNTYRQKHHRKFSSSARLWGSYFNTVSIPSPLRAKTCGWAKLICATAILFGRDARDIGTRL